MIQAIFVLGALLGTEQSNNWKPDNLSDRWKCIVIHHSATNAGGADAFDKNHKGRGWDELGYHFVIGNGTHTPDGKVEVGPRWHKQKHGAHCKTPDKYFNNHGIGICLVGDFTRTKPTAKQLKALDELIKFLTETCKIDKKHVTTHKHVTGKTECPGHHFPTERYTNDSSSETN